MQPVRNKIVGHSDLDTYVSDFVLGAHPKEKMDEYFENLQSYFDVAGVAVGVGPLDFRSSPGPGDAIVLRQTFNTFNHLFESDGETDRVLKESAA